MGRSIFVVFLLLNLIISVSAKANSTIDGMRFWQSPDNTRVVLDLSAPATHNVFTLSNPHRMVIDLDAARLSFDPADLDIKSSIVEHVRTSEKNQSVRVVLDLKSAVSYKAFNLPPYQSYGHRLVIDLADESTEPAPAKRATSQKQRDIVIAIDAGHGGEDPGAIGRNGTYEKTIVLDVAKRLARKIDKQPGMKAVLIRTGDYYVQLRKRTQIARQHQADIFISIHADGFEDSRANGASVWVVSPDGAQSEMGRWLEQSENESDLLGGVETLSDKDPLLAQVLLDLSTSYSVSASIDAATHVHNYIATVAPKMHKKRVERAAFIVLKMPDIPAMLVELAFISNPKEEKLLKSANYRNKLVSSIFKGINRYFRENPPDGTLYALQRKRSQEYVIRSGDTLSGIAQKFDVSLAELRSINKLSNDRIRVGQKLKLVP